VDWAHKTAVSSTGCARVCIDRMVHVHEKQMLNSASLAVNRLAQNCSAFLPSSLCTGVIGAALTLSSKKLYVVNRAGGGGRS